MKLRDLHPWEMSVREAQAVQSSLAPTVSRTNTIPEQVRYVAGVDISPPDAAGTVRGAVVVLSHPDLEIAEVSLAEGVPGFPYIPGLLSFRETPIMVKALERLDIEPDVIIVDGHGFAHPRRFGIACHLGLLTGVPAIGCAKSILVGKHGPLDADAGSRAELVHKDEVVGLALRTRTAVSPVYVSIGHKVDLSKAAEWVLACCDGVRIPKTTRLAHKAAAGEIEPGQRKALAAVEQARQMELP